MREGLIRTLFIGIINCFAGILYAQNLSLTGYSAISKTGININPRINISHRTILLNIGPRMTVSRSRNQFTPSGFASGVYYYPGVKTGSSNGFINFDYQFSFEDSHGEMRSTNNHNYIHEYTVGYGFQWDISKRLYIVNSIHIGGYTEVFYNRYRNEKMSVSRFNSQFKLGLGFQISNVLNKDKLEK